MDFKKYESPLGRKKMRKNIVIFAKVCEFELIIQLSLLLPPKSGVC